jgi:hypothetical protein
MKKLQIPSGNTATSQFVVAVRDNIEAITGRKGGKIVDAEEAASSPTQDEFNALVAKVNELLARLQD